MLCLISWSHGFSYPVLFLIRIFPLEGITSPVSILKIVVFPAPFTPRRPKHWLEREKKKGVNLNPNQRHYNLFLFLPGWNKLQRKKIIGIFMDIVMFCWHLIKLSLSLFNKWLLTPFFPLTIWTFVYIHRTYLTYYLILHYLCDMTKHPTSKIC